MSSEPKEEPVEATVRLTFGWTTGRGAPANFAVPFRFPAFVPALPRQTLTTATPEWRLNLVSD